MQLVNPFESPGEWYKANLHTHTTASDGEASLEERVRQYREKGYHVLAITDHGRTNDVGGFCNADFLALSGMETGGIGPNGEDYHLVLLNVPHGFECCDDADPNARIRSAKKAGGQVIVAHPYWCGNAVNDLLPIQGAIAIEVYNATCTKIGKGLSSVHWDDLLASGAIIPGVAVDDVHRGRDIFMGWTMLKMQSLTVESVMDALRTGCFYASCGPVVEDFHIQDGEIRVRCSPAAELHFMAQRSHGCSLYTDGGEPMTHAEIPLPGNWKYVRVEVVDPRGNRAWTNPLVLREEDTG